MTSIRVAGYELFERLGEGGGGQVYRATDASGRSLAVKLLGPAADLDPEAARARFRREVEILRQLDHPALATLVDHGLDDELGPYLVMPLVPGETLRKIIAGAKLCPEAAVLLLEPVASAVAALHERSLIHRDVKPENVMVTPDGRVVVVDLGLAWGPQFTRHSVDGAAIGSVPYMAPEQIEGSGVGTAADVWALGVMLYELVAGKRPFERTRASEEAAAALVGAYAPIDAVDPRVPPELAKLVAASLDRAPGARPTAVAFAAELVAAIDWIEAGDRARERAAIALAPSAYAARVAPFRVRREKRHAREAIAAGRPFQALAHVDRALAYAPDDPELRSLADDAEAKSSQHGRAGAGSDDGRATSGERGDISRAGSDGSGTKDRSGEMIRSVEAAPPVDLRRPARSWAIAGAIVGAAVLAAGATALVMHRGTDAPRTAAAPRDAGAGDATTVALVPADAGIAGADATDTALDTWAAPEPVPGLVALSLAGIPNDLPAHADDMKAPPGERLVAEDRLKTSDPVAAVAEVDAEVAQNPDRNNRLNQAMVYVAAGKPDALARLDKLLADYPDFASGWSAKGYLEVRAGHFKEAEAALSKAIELDPDDADTIRNRGILRDHLGRAREAYVDLVEALRRKPTDVEALAELAQVYSRSGHEPEARPILERLVRLRPSVTTWLDLSLVQPAHDALDSVEHALALAPDDPRANVRHCTVLAELGEQPALAACDKAVKLEPQSATAWMGRGLARYQIGKDKGGLADIDHAIDLSPNDAQYYVNRYILRRHAGMLAEAKQDLDRACKLGSHEACDELRK